MNISSTLTNRGRLTSYINKIRENGFMSTSHEYIPVLQYLELKLYASLLVDNTMFCYSSLAYIHLLPFLEIGLAFGCLR